MSICRMGAVGLKRLTEQRGRSCVLDAPRRQPFLPWGWPGAGAGLGTGQPAEPVPLSGCGQAGEQLSLTTQLLPVVLWS